MKGYKFITKDMKSNEGNVNWEIGKWKKEKKIKLCRCGLHASKEPLNSLEYIYGDRWFIVEARGKIIKDNDKFVAQEMRLVKEISIDKVLKPFAIWCAKSCLKNYEKKYPKDKRPREAIQAAEDYLNGKIDISELKNKISAAWSAARSAAWSAAESAWSAARSAAWSARSAAWSAWSAAWSAESAAWSAAESAAWSAARKSQNKKLKELIKNETHKN